MSMRQLKITKSITNREAQSLEKYLYEISQFQLITPEEEVKLAKQIKEGNQEALDKLTRANLRFVVSVAKQYQNQGLSLPDLINEGNIGLVKAAQRFDETRGFKFISYAVWWIRQSILQAIAEQSRMIHLPLNKVGLIGRIKKASATLEQKLEREPSVEELADAMEMDIDEIVASLDTNRQYVSIDHPLTEGEDMTLLDILENNDNQDPAKSFMKDDLSTEIDIALNRFSIRERTVIEMFFGIGYDGPISLEDIGDKLGLHRESKTDKRQDYNNIRCK